MSQYHSLYSAATCIENAIVLLDGGWISKDCAVSVRQLQVELILNRYDEIMLHEEGWKFCDSTMGVQQLQVESTLKL